MVPAGELTGTGALPGTPVVPAGAKPGTEKKVTIMKPAGGPTKTTSTTDPFLNLKEILGNEVVKMGSADEAKNLRGKLFEEKDGKRVISQEQMKEDAEKYVKYVEGERKELKKKVETLKSNENALKELSERIAKQISGIKEGSFLKEITKEKAEETLEVAAHHVEALFHLSEEIKKEQLGAAEKFEPKSLEIIKYLGDEYKKPGMADKKTRSLFLTRLEAENTTRVVGTYKALGKGENEKEKEEKVKEFLEENPNIGVTFITECEGEESLEDIIKNNKTGKLENEISLALDEDCITGKSFRNEGFCIKIGKNVDASEVAGIIQDIKLCRIESLLSSKKIKICHGEKIIPKGNELTNVEKNELEKTNTSLGKIYDRLNTPMFRVAEKGLATSIAL
jgi:hypothetical protein